MFIYLSLCILFVTALSQNLEAQKVVRIVPQNEFELEELRNSVRDYPNVDFWKEPTIVGYPVDILINSTFEYSILAQSFGKVEILIEDLSELINNQFDGQSRKLGSSYSYGPNAFECYDVYLSYPNIQQYIQSLVSKNPTIAKIVTIGRSLENRVIQGVQISVPSSSVKRGIYIDSAIHAREWIAPAVNLNILLNLLTGYTIGDPQVVQLLSQYDVTIVPVLNVDGYTFTWTTNRNWRKTRRPNPGGSFGVDMNRNAEVYFCQRGASTTPSSDTYCGPYANSEPELVATFEYIKNLGNVLVYWNLHSYGEEIILPYAYDNSIVTPDRSDHLRAGNLFWDAIYAATGEQYDKPRPPNGVYSGFAMDYIYINLGVKYSGLIELRDRGRYGFVLPESLICPNSLEIWEGFKAHARFAYANPNKGEAKYE
jgi:hypothetical protein